MSNNNCDLFQFSLTNGGLGYTFNQADFWDQYSSTWYMKDFAQIYRPKGFQKSDSDDDVNWINDWKTSKNNIFYPVQSGPKNGLTVNNNKKYLSFKNLNHILINNHVSFQFTFLFQIFLQGPRNNINKFKDFQINIHDPFSVADFTTSVINVKVGYETTFLITPSKIVATDDVKDLAFYRRNCKFDDETDKLVLFKKYTRSNCMFECQLKTASDKCQCVPWDYPQLERMTICDRFGRECFRKIMANESRPGNSCDCPLDCETTRYFYGENSHPIDVEGHCDTATGGYYRRYWDYHRDRNLPEFIRRYEEAIYGKDPSVMEHCINNTRQNVAIVHFHIASSANDQINKIVKTPRVTTADILSNIGGAMGLFTGFSILSFFEIIYWLYRLITVNL